MVQEGVICSVQGFSIKMRLCLGNKYQSLNLNIIMKVNDSFIIVTVGLKIVLRILHTYVFFKWNVAAIITVIITSIKTKKCAGTLCIILKYRKIVKVIVIYML